MRAHLHDALIWAILRDIRLFNVFVSEALQVDMVPEATWQRLDTHVLGPVQARRAVDGALVLRYGATTVAGALLEVQMARDEQKNYSWIGYLGATVSHLRCPTTMCIVTRRHDVADWAATVISDRPSAITRVVVLGPADWLAFALQFPDDALYQLMAWVCGYLHHEIIQKTRHILDAILALDSAESRGYLYLVQAVAQQLPPPYQEFIMNEMKDYRFLFPIHDIEYDWMEKGIEKGKRLGIQKGERLGIEKGERLGIEKGERLGIEKGERLGIEKGERLGRLEHAKATLARLDAKAATELASCDDVRLLDDAIDVAIRRLTSGQLE